MDGALSQSDERMLYGGWPLEYLGRASMASEGPPIRSLNALAKWALQAEPDFAQV